ncbi:hypothetical protein U9M48_001499 [Paspalum notatum var. saurae]|uniref:Uncharacterized protein n=1 Tax=Paspalum notatum var. saurae TaxID=547442 RepID=A0AAQ3PI98_PASNO
MAAPSLLPTLPRPSPCRCAFSPPPAPPVATFPCSSLAAAAQPHPKQSLDELGLPTFTQPPLPTSTISLLFNAVVMVAMVTTPAMPTSATLFRNRESEDGVDRHGYASTWPRLVPASTLYRPQALGWTTLETHDAYQRVLEISRMTTTSTTDGDELDDDYSYDGRR